MPELIPAKEARNYNEMKKNILDCLILDFNNIVKNTTSNIFKVYFCVEDYKLSVKNFYEKDFAIFPEIFDAVFDNFIKILEKNGYIIRNLTFDSGTYVLTVDMGEEKIEKMDFDPDRDVKMVYF